MTEWKPFWQLKSAVSSQSVKGVEVVDRAPVAVLCEFVGELVDPAYESRYCFNGTFCPVSCFKDPAVFAGCTFRLEKMKCQKENKPW